MLQKYILQWSLQLFFIALLVNCSNMGSKEAAPDFYQASNYGIDNPSKSALVIVNPSVLTAKVRILPFRELKTIKGMQLYEIPPGKHTFIINVGWKGNYVLSDVRNTHQIDVRPGKAVLMKYWKVEGNFNFSNIRFEKLDLQKHQSKLEEAIHYHKNNPLVVIDSATK